MPPEIDTLDSCWNKSVPLFSYKCKHCTPTEDMTEPLLLRQTLSQWNQDPRLVSLDRKSTSAFPRNVVNTSLDGTEALGQCCRCSAGVASQPIRAQLSGHMTSVDQSVAGNGARVLTPEEWGLWMLTASSTFTHSTPWPLVLWIRSSSLHPESRGSRNRSG